MDDFNAMALFACVVECKSFSKASIKSGVPTSSISRKVSELEKSLNIQLLERTTRTLRLTEKGRAFYEKIKPAICLLNDARIDLKDRNESDDGVLRISVPPGLEESLIIPCLSEFKKNNPNVVLKVIVTAANLKFVEDGIDVALRVGDLKDSNCIAHCLIEYQHVLVASPAYLKNKRTPVKPGDLSDQQIICATNWHDDAQWVFVKNNKKTVIDINESLSLNHYAAIKLAAENGLGIAELPLVNCQKEIQQRNLIQVLPKYVLSVYDQSTIKLSIVYTANRYNSVLIKNFKNFCVNYFNKAV